MSTAMQPVTLAALAPLPLWVGWQTEGVPGRTPTKVPYAPDGRKARSDAPHTWGTRAAAEARAALLPKPHDLGGIGLEFTTLEDGRALGGVDLDACRDPVTGAIEPWASKVIDRLSCYAEISPSTTGVKAFFTYDAAALPALRAAMGTDHGKMFKRGKGEHPPSIELHLGNRYFAVTDKQVDGTPPALRFVSVETLTWLIREAGPAFARNNSGGKAKSERADSSRSATAFRKGAALRRAGKTFEQMCAALRDDPETAEWTRDKGDANKQRELHRIWDKASQQEPCPTSIAHKLRNTVEAVITEFNGMYAVVNEAGKAIVYASNHDPILKRGFYDRITFDDFRRLYLNRKVQVGIDDKGRPILKSAAQVWLESPDRRQFIRGVTFNPSGRGVPPGTLNLWTGFAVTPRPGDWSLMRSHIRQIICDSNQENFDYVMGWMARLMQYPAEQGEVAVVMRGGEGTGKGTLAKALKHILGQHGLAISNSKHLTGNFNAHLHDAVFLFADEAFFAGDKANIGVLKSLITEPYLTVEAKYQNAVQMPNFLHVVMASNEEWVVPAALDARRWCVLDVSKAAKSQHGYFAAIWKQMEAGGYEAMLHDLLAYNLTGFNVRCVPITEGLQHQRQLSLGTTEAWWLDVLHRGYVFASKLGLEAEFSDWREEVSTELLVASYSAFADRRHERHPMSREALGRFIRRIGGKSRRLYNAPVGEHITDVPNPFGGTSRKAAIVEQPRAYGYHLGKLARARDAFVAETKLAPDWDDAEEGADA